MVLFEKQKQWGCGGGLSTFTLTTTGTHLVVREQYAPECGCCGGDREIEIPLPKEQLREALLEMLAKLDE
jgi:hypothetical protein